MLKRSEIQTAQFWPAEDQAEVGSFATRLGKVTMGLKVARLQAGLSLFFLKAQEGFGDFQRALAQD